MSSNGTKVGSVLVIGGGVAGMRAAADLAETGLKVHLVEASTATEVHLRLIAASLPTTSPLLAEEVQLRGRARVLLRRAVSDLGFSARSYHKVLRIARTIADLDEEAEVGPGHVAEAVQYRTLDRERGRQSG